MGYHRRNAICLCQAARLRGAQRWKRSQTIIFDDDCNQWQSAYMIDRKPSYYEFANQTLNLTEAEVFAKFALSITSFFLLILVKLINLCTGEPSKETS